MYTDLFSVFEEKLINSIKVLDRYKQEIKSKELNNIINKFLGVYNKKEISIQGKNQRYLELDETMFLDVKNVYRRILEYVAEDLTRKRNMCDVDEIMSMLDGNNSIKIQQKGIELAKNSGYIKQFILPRYKDNSKVVWENCAKILSDKKDEELIPYLSEILTWFQDLNWPGGIIILDRLQELPTQVIEPPILNIMEKAIQEKDYLWIEFLLYLKNIKTHKVVSIIMNSLERLSNESIMVIIEWLKELPESLKSSKVIKLIEKT
jgi:hypothetical protein